ncbi:DNA-packaging protein [Sphingomonas sp. GB1N7]|uniref:DNA-packaging protein n=1 Tax=Parasphingomonas caseinilytica TaxID=3096158 RepID=UPI002FCC19C9
MSAHERVALFDQLAELPQDERWRTLLGLTPAQRWELYHDWSGWAHEGQVPPPGDWRVWVIRAGRGFGKTRAGAEWVSDVARAMPGARIALVGATADEVRRVMIEGDAGLLAVARSDEPIRWRKQAGEVDFASGATGYLFAAAAPEKLRGPAHHAAWCDELAKWRYGDVAWDNLVLGLRLGDQPRVVVTTTPRPVALMRRVLTGKDVVETRGRTFDNPHLPSATRQSLEDLYAGSRLGRQELDGELIDDVEGALWTRDMIEACRLGAGDAPGRDDLVRVVVAVDPPAGTISGTGGDACGIVCVALGHDGLGYVLEDATVKARSPEGWARAVAACAARWQADRVVAERNQGGEMVRSVLKAADAALPIRLVHASRGKVARAEPVTALYETKRVRHVGAGLGALEDELCGLVVGGAYVGASRSPDRADALVWALTELMLSKHGNAAVWQL